MGSSIAQRALQYETAQGSDDAAHRQRRAPCPEWLDYPLKGDWSDHRECHIGGDFLLIYTIDGNLVNFVRAGTHSELFE
ncbi:type II toxin-antitoxin system YafQ family toxin [Novosphingobium sp.]|uniref:type II toxin-antitoxin system YafQ family toxin n=1 Tax=Novosphingobium sp. TaxID=1874826 RepID=UPI002FD8BEFD